LDTEDYCFVLFIFLIRIKGYLTGGLRLVLLFYFLWRRPHLGSFHFCYWPCYIK